MFKQLSWKHNMVVHPWFGVYCDGRKRCAFNNIATFTYDELRIGKESVVMTDVDEECAENLKKWPN